MRDPRYATVAIPADAYRQIKLLALQHDLKIRDLFTAVVAEYLERRGIAVTPLPDPRQLALPTVEDDEFQGLFDSPPDTPPKLDQNGIPRDFPRGI